jgi:hypothetical protein
MPRHFRSCRLEDPRDQVLGGRLPSRVTARDVLVLDARAAVLQHVDDHEDAVEQVERLEARDDDGHVVLPLAMGSYSR